MDNAVRPISIHALREEGDTGDIWLRVICRISIHALREEGDSSSALGATALPDFYPRPPRGGRPCFLKKLPHSQKFLSTPSARRTTAEMSDCTLFNSYFYPRPPRGGRPASRYVQSRDLVISIHALREEGDCIPAAIVVLGGLISIHALREEGDVSVTGSIPIMLTISIHALREEGDKNHRSSKSKRIYFYPRPPRGGRRRATRQRFP